MDLLRAFIRVITSVVFLASMTYAGNRFNVFGWADYDSTLNKQGFYRDLDNFGISWFLTFPADSGAYYKIHDTLDVNFVSHHWLGGYTIKLDSAKQLDLCMAPINSINGRMSGENAVVRQGYLSGTRLGRSLTDGDLGRTIWSALTNEYDSGIVVNRFTQGVFDVLNKSAAQQEVRFEACLRRVSTPEDTNAVIARLIFEDERGRWYCGPQTTYEYNFTRLNDTLLIVGTPSGLDTFPTSDRTTRGIAKDVNVPECLGAPATFDGRDYPNVCYWDSVTATEICARPWRFIKEVRAADLPSTGQYYTLGSDCITPGAWGTHNYKVDWTDKASIYLDSFWVCNETGKALDSLIANDAEGARQRVRKYYDDSMGVYKAGMRGFYVIDEAYGTSLKVVGQMKSLFSGLGTGYPDTQVTCLGPYSNMDAIKLGGAYYDTYINYTNQNGFLFWFYPNECWHSLSSDVSDVTNWQRTLDSVIIPGRTTYSYYLIPRLKNARQKADQLSAQLGRPIDFQIALPSHSAWLYDSLAAKWVQTSVYWTEQQIRCVVNLALAYGARGIGYWPYSGHGALPPVPPDTTTSDVTALSRAMSMAAANSELEPPPTGTDGVDSLCDMYPSICVCSTARPHSDVNGLVQLNADWSWYHGDNWEAYRRVNMYLDSMAYFFNYATWKSSDNWNANLAAMTGSFVDSIRSRATYSNPYLQVSFFEKDAQKYAYIVNRRVDSLFQHVDSQTVDIFMSGQGAYQVWDVYANHCDTVWDSCGIVRWNHFLKPGAAVLIKKVPIWERFKGVWAGTWPQYSTIKVVGDVTVNSGQTLTIQTNNVTVMPNTDSLSSGWDAHKCEFIVNGTLKLLGTTSNRIYIRPVDSTLDSSWYGIRTQMQNSKLYADNLVIKNAYSGLQLFSLLDTIKNSRIEDCFMYGVESYGKGYLEKDTLWSNNTQLGFGLRYSMMYGVSVLYSEGAALTLKDCYIKGPKYPVYVSDSYTVLMQGCRITADTSMILPYTAAVTEDEHSHLTLKNCRIENYERGVALLYHSTLDIDSCWIGTSAWNYSGYGMLIGVSGDSSGISTCKVRNSCFNHIHDYSVFRRWGSFDLGTAAESGNNRFMVDTMAGNPYSCYPPYAIYNTGGTTVYARGNHFDDLYNPVANHVTSGVDITGYCYTQHGACLRCDEHQGQDPPGPDGKVAGMTPADTFAVGQNYPNPFNPVTQIRFTLPATMHALIEIYNILGQRIRTIANQEFGPGEHFVLWDGTNADGEPVSSGIYLYRVAAGEFVQTRKMMLLK